MAAKAVIGLPRFALLGAGRRRKALYRAGRLLDALTGEVLREWEVAEESYDWASYRVRLTLTDGSVVTVWEDERALWVTEGDHTTCLSEGHANLPDFAGRPQAPLLRRLHHEMLVNLVDGAPLPNLLVYSRPWYRDAAMVAMCLERTGNLHLIADWIGSLREPFDRNNAGNEEPDNLGQLLYLISLASPPASREPCHPIVPLILAAAERFRQGDHLVGLTDGGEHPVYQTKWLKFGLRALGLPDPWVIPEVHDSYSALFWMAYRDRHVPGASFPSGSADRYPYLAWAEAHFHGWPPPRLTPPGLSAEASAEAGTWEAYASEADYSRMALVAPEYVQQRVCVPHTWHAAEVFLYFHRLS